MKRKNIFKSNFSLFHILVHHSGVFGYSRRFTELSEFKSYFKDTPKDQILIVWVLYKSTVDPIDLYVQYEISQSSKDDSLWQCSINGQSFLDFRCDNILDLIDKFEGHISNP